MSLSFSARQLSSPIRYSHFEGDAVGPSVKLLLPPPLSQVVKDGQMTFYVGLLSKHKWSQFENY